MSNYMVDSSKVLEVAGNIERVNNNLRDTMENSKNKVRGLDSVWEGRAADETVMGFCSFMDKYSIAYYEMINNFVMFLRRSVAAGAMEAERANTGA
ncbi:MAG: hypothetical protein FWG40_12680 [Peptococcaceae bacterium]|nr:hypothetical protein [Peptococcaceae bacterium]